MTDQSGKSLRQLFLGLLFLLGISIYSNSLQSPFQFDDFANISKNKSLSHLADIPSLWDSNLKTRFLPYLSFAANLFWDKTDVWGYHFFNITLHIFNSFWVFFLVSLLFKTPKLRSSDSQQAGNDIAALSAFLFLCHPLQTQAVTYIVQRITSMEAFFYLGTIVFYLKARLDQSRSYYDAALAMAVAAMLSKEIACTLPLTLMLVEGVFWGAEKKKETLVRLLPFLAIALLVPVLLFYSEAGKGRNALQSIIFAKRADAFSLPGEYFLTQLNVLCTYLRLFFFPVNQNLDYDYPVSHSLLEPKTLLCFALLFTLFVAAFWIVKKNRLITFSILWFFLVLSPQSSFFSKGDVMVEHRMYLPLVGCAIFLSAGLYAWLRKSPYFVAAGAIIVLVFSGMTYARNHVWRSEISLWEDVVKKSPQKARGYNNLGHLYYSKLHRKKEGLAFFEKAFQKNPHYAPAVYNLAIAYENEGKINQALAFYQKAVALVPRSSTAYERLGLAYQKAGDIEKAAANLEKALQLKLLRTTSYKHE